MTDEQQRLADYPAHILEAGVRAVLVHALNDHAKQFYEHYGFQRSPIQPMTLMLRLTI